MKLSVLLGRLVFGPSHPPPLRGLMSCEGGGLFDCALGLGGEKYQHPTPTSAPAGALLSQLERRSVKEEQLEEPIKINGLFTNSRIIKV